MDSSGLTKRSKRPSILGSSVGKKAITGLTGLALVGFVIGHLVGNLTLFLGPDAFNGYAHFLESLGHGFGIYIAEAGLIALFLAHIVSAVSVAVVDKRNARAVGYRYSRDAKGKSRKTLASKTMIYTGTLILIFVVVHIRLFKYGRHDVGPDGVKNLYKTVVTEFQNPYFMVATVIAMILLGFHIRHGFWSAFQSLGLSNDRYIDVLIRIGIALAVMLTLGFSALAVVLFLWGNPSAAVGGH